MSGKARMKGKGSEMVAILDEASPECKRALIGILRVERDHLPQKNPNASKLAREIAKIIRESVP
jgi:hypothetical protein